MSEAVPIHEEDHSYHIADLLQAREDLRTRVQRLEHGFDKLDEVVEKLDKLTTVLTPAMMEELTHAVRVFKWTKGLGSIVFWLAMVSSGVMLTWSSIVEVLKYLHGHGN